MDAVTIIGLVSNIISFIDLGSKFVKEVREIYNSASGATGDALSHGLIAGEMRRFANDLVPSGQAVNKTDKAICDLAEECKSVAEAILKLLDEIKPKRSGSSFRSVRSAIKGLWYEKDISNLQARLEKCRSQLGLQLSYATSSEIKDQLKMLAKHSQEGGTRILKLQQQVQELHRTVETSDLRLRQGVQNLLQLSDDSYTALITQRLLDSLRFDEMDGRFRAVARAHEKTFGWIFKSHDENNEKEEHLEDSGHSPDDYDVFDKSGGSEDDAQEEDLYRTTARKSFLSWLEYGHGIFHISGKLGSGKSTLMKFLYTDARTQEMLRKWAGSGTLVMGSFFFWKPGSQLQKSTTGLFRSLLHQTLSKVPSLVPEIVPEQWKEITSIPWQAYSKIDFSPETLEEAFRRLIDSQSEDLRICFFIDGLDEREEMSIDDDNRAMADGIFLWVALVTKRLDDLHENGACWRRLREELNHAPQGLTGLFAHIIQSLDPSDRKLAYQTFAMLRKARKYEFPLPLLSYPFIDYYREDSDTGDYTDWRAENMSESARIVQARKMLMGYCGGLVEAASRSFGDLYDVDLLTISFTHRSVPEFLDSMKTEDMEKSLRGFCAEDAVCQLFLAYLWARDPSECKDYRRLSVLTGMIVEMRKYEKIGREPFIFEEQLELALARLGVRSILEQDDSSPSDFLVPLPPSWVIITNVAKFHEGPEREIYEICSPYLVAACLGCFPYTLWKVRHDPLVTCTPLQRIVLLYCILCSRMEEEDSTIVRRILDILLEKGLGPQTTTNLVPRGDYFPYLDVTVWQHLIIHFLIPANHVTISSRSVLWKWALENKADPHFVMCIPRKEIHQGQTYSHRTTLILGKDKRRLDGVPMKVKLHSLIRSEKYPDAEGTGIRVTLIDIINEKKFENREELIALCDIIAVYMASADPWDHQKNVHMYIRYLLS
ncbi:hypothetical protein CDV55_107910 [Aspergillus turcosus]|nr:hypothetical protein CDV55_107910 [Aspergillus turcosus]